MVRIRIVGGPGSGKTTIAKELSKKLKIPHYDLDDIHWDNKAKTYGITRDEKQREKLLNAALKKKDWIIEGAYTGGWVDPTFEKADTIIIVNTGRVKRKYRILKRFTKRRLGLYEGKRESLKDIYGLLKWNWGYDSRNLTRIDRKKYARKIIECTTTETALKHLRGLK